MEHVYLWFLVVWSEKYCTDRGGEGGRRGGGGGWKFEKWAFLIRIFELLV